MPDDARIVTTGGLDDPSIKDVAEVARLLGADLEHGLTSQEAALRLARDGANELRSAPPVPTWRRILAQFQDPLVYLLLGAVAVCMANCYFAVKLSRKAVL